MGADSRGEILVGRQNAPITRRRLLKGGVRAAVAGLAAWKGLEIGNAAKNEVEKDINAVSSAADSLLHPRSGEVASSQGADEVVVIKPRVLTEIDTAYPNLSLQDRKAFVNSLAQLKSTIEPDITWEVVERIQKVGPLIKKYADSFGISEDLLRGLAIWESKCDPRAVSYETVNGQRRVVARGLTQMKDEEAVSFGLKVTNDANDERYDADKILKATARELKSRYETFGDWGLALWSWHAGEPRVYAAIKSYMGSIGKPIEDINVQIQGPSEQAKAEATAEAIRRKGVYRSVIAREGINLYKLFNNSKVVEMFEGSGWDKTDEYVPRIIASSRIYKDQKELLGLAA